MTTDEADTEPGYRINRCHTCRMPLPLHAEECLVAAYMAEAEHRMRLKILAQYATTHAVAAIYQRVRETAQRGIVEDAWIQWRRS